MEVRRDLTALGDIEEGEADEERLHLRISEEMSNIHFYAVHVAVLVDYDTIMSSKSVFPKRISW